MALFSSRLPNSWQHDRILSRKPSSSLFAALALGASIGLLLPALIVGGLFIGLREGKVAEQALQRDLDAKLDVLASSLPELLWNLDAVAAREVVSAIVKSPEVVRVSVSDASQGLPFIENHMPERRLGRRSPASATSCAAPRASATSRSRSTTTSAPPPWCASAGSTARPSAASCWPRSRWCCGC